MIFFTFNSLQYWYNIACLGYTSLSHPPPDFIKDDWNYEIAHHQLYLRGLPMHFLMMLNGPHGWYYNIFWEFWQFPIFNTMYIYFVCSFRFFEQISWILLASNFIRTCCICQCSMFIPNNYHLLWITHLVYRSSHFQKLIFGVFSFLKILLHLNILLYDGTIC